MGSRNHLAREQKLLRYNIEREHQRAKWLDFMPKVKLCSELADIADIVAG